MHLCWLAGLQEGKTALDSGLSTGGFTDCMLQAGAAHVWGVDVGYGQVGVAGAALPLVGAFVC